MEGLKKLSGKNRSGQCFPVMLKDVIFSFIFNQFEINIKKYVS